MSNLRFRFSVDLATCPKDTVEWQPATVELCFLRNRDAPVLYSVEVLTHGAKLSEPADEVSTIRERVGRIAKRLEDVTAELRMLAEGLSSEESAQVLEKIERSLGMDRG